MRKIPEERRSLLQRGESLKSSKWLPVVKENTNLYFSGRKQNTQTDNDFQIIPYPTAFPYGNGMILHFYQQQESSTTKTVHKVINKGLKAYV